MRFSATAKAAVAVLAGTCALARGERPADPIRSARKGLTLSLAETKAELNVDHPFHDKHASAHMDVFPRNATAAMLQMQVPGFEAVEAQPATDMGTGQLYNACTMPPLPNEFVLHPTMCSHTNIFGQDVQFERGGEWVTPDGAKLYTWKQNMFSYFPTALYVTDPAGVSRVVLGVSEEKPEKKAVDDGEIYNDLFDCNENQLYRIIQTKDGEYTLYNRSSIGRWSVPLLKTVETDKTGNSVLFNEPNGDTVAISKKRQPYRNSNGAWTNIPDPEACSVEQHILTFNAASTSPFSDKRMKWVVAAMSQFRIINRADEVVQNAIEGSPFRWIVGVGSLMFFVTILCCANYAFLRCVYMPNAPRANKSKRASRKASVPDYGAPDDDGPPVPWPYNPDGPDPNYQVPDAGIPDDGFIPEPANENPYGGQMYSPEHLEGEEPPSQIYIPEIYGRGSGGPPPVENLDETQFYAEPRDDTALFGGGYGGPLAHAPITPSPFMAAPDYFGGAMDEEQEETPTRSQQPERNPFEAPPPTAPQAKTPPGARQEAPVGGANRPKSQFDSYFEEEGDADDDSGIYAAAPAAGAAQPEPVVTQEQEERYGMIGQRADEPQGTNTAATVGSDPLEGSETMSSIYAPAR